VGVPGPSRTPRDHSPSASCSTASPAASAQIQLRKATSGG
jgi:hypothetical protein